MRNLPLLSIIIICITAILSSCGEDRSDEQPFAPTLSALTATQTGDSTVLLSAQILSSKNSSITACGFIWGDSTGSNTLSLDSLPAVSTSPHIAPSQAVSFSAAIDTLAPGTYFALAFATNGIGTTRTDTISFSVR